MDFSMNYYLRLSWIDPKLAFKPEDNLGRDEITLETRDITGNPLVFQASKKFNFFIRSRSFMER